MRIYRLCKALENDKTARLIASQLLRAGTSIGANTEEAVSAQSKKDFIAKMTISLKEARETNYWLRILRDAETISADKLIDIIDESEQIMKIIAKIIITAKKNESK